MTISDIAPYLHSGLELVGGSVVLYQSVSKASVAAAPHLVDLAFDKAFAHPKVAAALTRYRPQIEAFFDAAGAQLKKRLDATVVAAVPADAAKPG